MSAWDLGAAAADETSTRTRAAKIMDFADTGQTTTDFDSVDSAFANRTCSAVSGTGESGSSVLGPSLSSGVGDTFL